MLRKTLLALFAFLSLPAGAAPCAGFTDVDTSSPFCANVAWMKSRAITLGCTATLYCPNDAVSRLAMAAFLNRLGDVLLPPNVVWVAPAGGQFQSIQGAIDYVYTNGKTPAVIQVAPGTYPELVTLRPYVRLQGSGKQLTRIQPTGCATANASAVTMAGAAQLQDVTIETSCENGVLFFSPPAVLAYYGDSAVQDVDIVINLPGTSGIRITGNISAVGPIERVRMYLESAPNYGIFVDASSGLLRMSATDIDIAIGGSPGNTGVKLDGFGIVANLARITVGPNGGANTFGLDASGATVRIRDSVLYGATAMRSVSASIQAAYVGLSSANSGAGITCAYAYNASTLAPVVC
ncbi:MAG: hypothetical protein U1F54_02620 [Burkholderiales bacterium]